MGQPSGSHIPLLPQGRANQGTETSNYPEEEKSTEIPQVAASERGRAQTGGMQILPGLWGLVDGDRKHSGTRLERRTGEGESPVCETQSRELTRYPSRPGHEKSRLNLGGPSSKAKYELMTDSAEYR